MGGVKTRGYNEQTPRLYKKEREKKNVQVIRNLR